MMNRLITSSRFLFCLQPPPLETNINSLRKQLLYRSRNLGMRELDLLIGTWAEHHIYNLSEPQLQEFHSQVLKHETPDLVKKLMGQLPI